MSAAARTKGKSELSDVQHLEVLRSNLDTLIFNFRNQGHLVAAKYQQYLDSLRKFRPRLGATAKSREFLYQVDIHLETLGARVARVVEIDACLREVHAAFAVLKRAEIAWQKSMPDAADRHWGKVQEMSGFLGGEFTDHPEIIEYAERFRAFRDVMSGRASTLEKRTDSLLEEYMAPKERRGLARPLTSTSGTSRPSPSRGATAGGTPVRGRGSMRTAPSPSTKAPAKKSPAGKQAKKRGVHEEEYYSYEYSEGEDAGDDRPAGARKQSSRTGVKQPRQQQRQQRQPRARGDDDQDFDDDTAGGSGSYSYSYYSGTESAGGTTARSRKARKEKQ